MSKHAKRKKKKREREREEYTRIQRTHNYGPSSADKPYQSKVLSLKEEACNENVLSVKAALFLQRVLESI